MSLDTVQPRAEDDAMFCHARQWGWAPVEDEEPVRWFRPVADGTSVRVSQVDRDAVVAQLSRHTGEGRLTLAEFEERVEEAYAAATRADLDHALRELPRDREHAPRRETAARRRGPWRPPALLVIAVVIAIAAATTWWAMWLLWPGLAWASGAGCGPRRTHRARTAYVGRHADDVIRV